MIKINVGCGRDIKPGWVNMDRAQGPGVDLVNDISWGGLEMFKNDSVDEILASHVLEHVFEWERFIREAHRVLKPGGVLEVRVPHAKGPWAYIAHHVRQFMPYTLDHFIKQGNGTPSSSLDQQQMFSMLSREIVRHFPYEWHIKKYLGLDMPNPSPIGRPYEIHWRLMKMAQTSSNRDTEGSE